MAKQFALTLFFPPARRKAALVVSLLLCTPGLSLSGYAEQHNITTFDVPGAGTASGQGTFSIGINLLGVISGYYIDGGNVSHGFLRSRDGKLTTFDDPHATNLAGGGTNVVGMNLEGAVVGAYITATYHGFVRSPEGKFTTVDWPGACAMSISEGCHGSGVWDINTFGTMVGPYEDTSGNFVAHTGIRTPDGKVTTFAVPGSSMEAGQGTLPASFSGLNQWGAITGLYYDANNGFHGYLRSPWGTFIKFEAPGADITIPYNGTFPASLNDAGMITGDYLDVNEVYHGFIRGPEGKFETFEIPGADTTPGSYNGTAPNNINELGVITGYYTDAANVAHGFVRFADGAVVTFDAPGAGTGAFQGTVSLSNNLEGAATGYFVDGAGVSHGFVWRR
jgi:hypothetical protein